MSNRFTGFSPQQYVESYQRLPWEMLAGMGEMYNKKLEEEDQYKAMIGKGLASINAINKDSHLQKRQELVNGYNTELAKLDAEAANDPIAALPKYKQFVYKLQQDLTSGEAATLNATYSDFQKDKENLMKEKDIDSNEAVRILNRSIEQTPDFEYDANKGATSLYNSFGYVKDPDIQKRALELIKTMSPDARKKAGIGYSKDAAGNDIVYNWGNESKILTPSQIVAAIGPLLSNDQKVMDYLRYQEDLNTPYSTYNSENPEHNPTGDKYANREKVINSSAYNRLQDMLESYGHVGKIDERGSTQSDLKEAPYGTYNLEHQADYIPRFEGLGTAINPQTLPKTSSEITSKISEIDATNAKLDLYRNSLSGVAYENTTNTIIYNNILKKKYQDLKAKADSYGAENVTPEDKKLFAKYGEWNPGNNSDPVYRKIISDMEAAGKLPNGNATVKEVMSYLGSTDPIGDGKRLSYAYNRKNEISDDYLKKHSDELSIQPKTVSIDNTKDGKLSNALDEFINTNSVTYFDENGPITDPSKMPTSVKSNSITKEPVDQLGHLIAVQEVVTDPQSGKKTFGRKLYAKVDGNASSEIGKQIMNEGLKEKDSHKYTIGLRMSGGSQYTGQLSDINVGENKTIIKTNQETLHSKPFAVVSREKAPDGSEVWKISGVSGYKDGTYGSREEVDIVLNKLSK